MTLLYQPNTCSFVLGTPTHDARTRFHDAPSRVRVRHFPVKAAPVGVGILVPVQAEKRQMRVEGSSSLRVSYHV